MDNLADNGCWYRLLVRRRNQTVGADRFANEIIMDYSIPGAIVASFKKIIFVIRKDIEEDLWERIGRRVEAICAKHGVETAYVFQDINNVPEIVPAGKPRAFLCFN